MAQPSTSPTSLFRRETAERETAEDGSRTLTQEEHLAIVADRVARETAEITSKVSTLETENADLKSKLSAAETARETAEAAAATAQQALTEREEREAREKAAADRFDDRAKRVREAAYHLKDDFFTDERLQRAAGMEDEAFEGYVKELAEMAEASGAVKPEVKTTDGAPRETAMHGSSVKEKSTKGNLASVLRGPGHLEQKGA